MAEPALRVAVVGHVNAGKTTLLRTLARQSAFGETDVLPGTTTRMAQAELALPEAPLLAWMDTPGFEDPLALAERWSSLRSLPSLPSETPLTERLQALLRQPEVATAHPQEWRALSSARGSDAILLVVDCVELVLPKHRAALELLLACERPILAVLNRPKHPMARVGEWNDALWSQGIAQVIACDAASPEPGTVAAVLQALSALLSPRVPGAARLEPAWRADRQTRHEAALVIVSDALVGLAARRTTLSRTAADNPEQRAEAVQVLRRAVLDEMLHAQRALLSLHGFNADAALPMQAAGMAGRWASDLFNTEVLKDAGGKLAGGAAVGAAIGLAADVALGGASLGAGAAIGSAVGGAASQGFAATGRKIMNLVTGQVDLTVDDAVLVEVADRLLVTEDALLVRGHGDSRPWAWPARRAIDGPSAAALAAELAKPRGNPAWARGVERSEGEEAARRRFVEHLAAIWRKQPGAGNAVVVSA